MTQDDAMSGDPPVAGWYDDPAGGEGLRWWDGAQWTGTVQARPDRGRRRRRWPLLVGGMVLAAVLGGGVTAALVGIGTSGAADGFRLPDVVEPPETAWTFDAETLLREAFPDADAERLESGRVWAVPAEPGHVAVIPRLGNEPSAYVHGLDISTGELAWTSERFGRDGEAAPRVDCLPAERETLFCIWDAEREDGSSEVVLRGVSATDGSTQFESVAGRADNTNIALVEGDVVLARATESETVVSRHTVDGTTAWQERLGSASGVYVHPPAAGAVVVERRHTDSGGGTMGTEYSAVGLDAATGQPLSWLPEVSARSEYDADSVSLFGEQYGTWGDTVVKSVASGDRQEMVGLDDQGRETWRRDSRDGEAIGADLAEFYGLDAGTPLVLRYEDGVSAYDLEDGELLWSHSASVAPQASVPTAEAVILSADDREEIQVLDAADGQVRWQSRLSHGGNLQPGRRLVYALQRGGTIRALDLADGEEQWAWQLPGIVPDSVGELIAVGDQLVYHSGTVLVGSG